MTYWEERKKKKEKSSTNMIGTVTHYLLNGRRKLVLTHKVRQRGKNWSRLSTCLRIDPSPHNQLVCLHKTPRLPLSKLWSKTLWTQKTVQNNGLGFKRKAFKIRQQKLLCLMQFKFTAVKNCDQLKWPQLKHKKLVKTGLPVPLSKIF